MSLSQSIHQSFIGVMKAFNSSPAIEFLQAGCFTVEHYKSVLRETFHYTRENPQIQALAAVYFRGRDRDSVQLFLRHAISEVGHDQMALNDFQSLGGDASEVACENPLPATTAFNAFPFFTSYAKALMQAGVPETAMSFLQEHMHVDIAHNKLMEQYLGRLVHDQSDADAIIYSMQVTGELYANMLWSAISRAENPRSFGMAWTESTRVRSSAAPANIASQMS